MKESIVIKERRQCKEQKEDPPQIQYDDISYDCESGLNEYQYGNDVEDYQYGKDVEDEYEDILEIISEDEHTVVSQFTQLSQLSQQEEKILRGASSCCSAAAKRFSVVTLIEFCVYLAGWHWLYNNAT